MNYTTIFPKNVERPLEDMRDYCEPLLIINSDYRIIESDYSQGSIRTPMRTQFLFGTALRGLFVSLPSDEFFTRGHRRGFTHSKLSGFLAMLYIKADTNKITDNVRPLMQIVLAPIPEASLPSGELSYTIKL